MFVQTFIKIEDILHKDTGCRSELFKMPNMNLFLFRFCKVFIFITLWFNAPIYARKAQTTKNFPTIESKSKGNCDFYVIFLTGDFGFLNFDKAIVHDLNAKNVSVVVINSMKYFQSAKSPAQLGSDLGSIINQYNRKWNQRKVVIMGYSMGAEVIPFAINRLDEKSLLQLMDIILIAPAQKAIFRLKPTDYLFEDKKGTDIYTELLKMRAQRSYIICDNSDLSICRKNLEGVCDHDFLGGGHHFGRNYLLLSKLIGRRLKLE
jgi:type IV secretory pathway VirJ component